MEMWCKKRLMKAKWTERINNEEVLRRAEEKINHLASEEEEEE
jgi:hypothetical protein